jgi:hypothetical protein
MAASEHVRYLFLLIPDLGLPVKLKDNGLKKLSF